MARPLTDDPFERPPGCLTFCRRSLAAASPVVGAASGPVSSERLDLPFIGDIGMSRRPGVTAMRPAGIEPATSRSGGARSIP